MISLITFCVGLGSLVYYTIDFNYSHKTVQYGEFWSVIKAGDTGSTFLDEQGINKYKYWLNLDDQYSPGNVTYELNHTGNFYYFLGIDVNVGIPDPNALILYKHSPWLSHAQNFRSRNYLHDIYTAGLSTPHNISIRKLDLLSRLSFNNETFNYEAFNMTRYRELKLVGKDFENSETGYLFQFSFLIKYESYTQYNRTVAFYLVTYDAQDHAYRSFVKGVDLNKVDNVTLDFTADWTTSFTQQFGDSVIHIGKGPLAHMIFKKDKYGNVLLNITFYSYYKGPIPTYTKFLRIPYIESGTTIIGGVAALYFLFKYGDTMFSDDMKRKRLVRICVLGITIGILYFLGVVFTLPGYIKYLFYSGP